MAGVVRLGQMLGHADMAHRHPVGARAHGVEMAFLQIGRQRRIDAFAVAASESLPGEIIVLQREIAGQFIQPRAQHVRHLGVTGQCLELCRRNAEAEQRGGLIGQPADEALVENRREPRFEDAALLLDIPGLQQLLGIDAIEPGDQMGHADEPAEQPALVHPLGKASDAATPGKIAALPIGAAGLVQMRADEPFIRRDIVLAVRVGKEAAETVIVRQILRRRQFQAVKRHMGGVEIDRHDLSRIGGEIGQDIAAAAGDAGNAVPRRNLQRLHIDHGVFPDLRIDQAFEGEGERAVPQLAAALMAQHGLFYFPVLFGHRYVLKWVHHPLVFIVRAAGDAAIHASFSPAPALNCFALAAMTEDQGC